VAEDHRRRFSRQRPGALSAALGVALHKGDIYAPLIRDAAGRFAFFCGAGARRCPHLSRFRASARCADARRMSIAANARRLLRMISHLGAISPPCPRADGAPREGRGHVAGATCIGDGGDLRPAASTRTEHGGGGKTPRWSSWSRTINSRTPRPTSRQYASRTSLTARSATACADTNSTGLIAACLDVVGESCARAREGGGRSWSSPIFAPRRHGEHDDAHYVSTR